MVASVLVHATFARVIIFFFRSYSFSRALWTHISHSYRTLKEITLLINTVGPDYEPKTLSYQGDDI